MNNAEMIEETKKLLKDYSRIFVRVVLPDGTIQWLKLNGVKMLPDPQTREKKPHWDLETGICIPAAPTFIPHIETKPSFRFIPLFTVDKDDCSPCWEIYDVVDCSHTDDAPPLKKTLKILVTYIPLDRACPGDTIVWYIADRDECLYGSVLNTDKQKQQVTFMLLEAKDDNFKYVTLDMLDPSARAVSIIQI